MKQVDIANMVTKDRLQVRAPFFTFVPLSGRPEELDESCSVSQTPSNRCALVSAALKDCTSGGLSVSLPAL